jgi:hypothetical protein
MGIWMEIRCEGRLDDGAAKECHSSDNSGPSEMADDTAISVAATLRLLNQDARSGTNPWRKTKVGWFCPACAVRLKLVCRQRPAGLDERLDQGI